MDSLRAFFELNREIVQFLYGLVFFVLGLAIAVQSRSYSRLELARSLGWLAAFGLTHSLYEWSELFAHVQEAYLSLAGILVLHIFHLATLCLSFFFLFEFGIALLRPLRRGQWLHTVSLALAGIYLIVIVGPLLRWLPSPHEWHASAEALARYFIAFPAGLLAAYGLREQTFRHIAPLHVPYIIRTLRVAGVALAAYGIAGGLIPPLVPFFPGNWLNSASFEQWLGVPPLLLTGVIGLILAVAVIRALEVFDLETRRHIEAMEQQQIVASERNRIARDLHDGAIQTVYTAGLLVESARSHVPADSPAAGRLEKAMGVLNDAIAALRRNLVEMRSAPETVALPTALNRLASDARFRSLVDIEVKLDLPAQTGLAPASTEHVLAIVSEALSNVVRHARARRVLIEAVRENGRLRLSVQDDGQGISSARTDGFGLRNMRDRARLLGGQLQVSATPGHGTRVSLDIPVDQEA
jgi:signal transduction histidine kinase